MKHKKVLIIDNYDSFTYNIVCYLRALNAKVQVIKSDELDCAKELESFCFSHLIISPGPNAPEQAPLSVEAILHFGKTKRILGVCLGYQCIVQGYGGKIARLDSPKHGKVATIRHIPNELFKGIPQEFEVCLYHSLYAKSLPPCLLSTAISQDGIEMALKHRIYPTFGVQFHPEAILSHYGKRLFRNFLSL